MSTEPPLCAAADPHPLSPGFDVVDDNAPATLLADCRVQGAVACRVDMLYDSNARIDSLARLAKDGAAAPVPCGQSGTALWI